MSRPAALLASLLGFLLALPAGGNGLPDRPRAVIKQQLVPDDAVTVVVRDVLTGENVVEMNATTPRTPASVMKVLPTFAALDILGPAYTWKTRAYAGGPVTKGVLQGNLYLKGGGDPLMTIERWWRFVTDLRQTGLRAIEGDIVVDETLFAPTDERPGDFDGRPWRTYNLLPNPLLVNLQSSEFIVRPNDETGAIDVAVDPFPANLTVENRLRAVNARCAGRNRTFAVTSPPGNPDKIVVSGSVSMRCPRQSYRRVIMTPADFAYGTFRRLWEQQGGTIAGGLTRAPTPTEAKQLLSQESLTLGEIVRVTNKYSSNVMARTLVLTLDAEKGKVPATVVGGEAVIKDWLAGRGLHFEELVIGNGSGLSRVARISGKSLAELLQAAWRGRFAPEFLATLPLGGLDGTLRKRFERVKDPSRIRMKTGTLNGVSSIAGYVTGDSGRTYVVVVMVNSRGAQYGAGDVIQGAVIEWVLGQ
jgi:D-alanyl-D-alanine carboxypeptidase/D-alanyl-D-alanine-endopeptidase (penicillin-binding protein 4)